MLLVEVNSKDFSQSVSSPGGVRGEGKLLARKSNFKTCIVERPIPQKVYGFCLHKICVNRSVVSLTLCNPMDCSPPVGKVNMMEVLVYFFSQSVIGIL